MWNSLFIDVAYCKNITTGRFHCFDDEQVKDVAGSGIKVKFIILLIISCIDVYALIHTIIIIIFLEQYILCIIILCTVHSIQITYICMYITYVCK